MLVVIALAVVALQPKAAGPVGPAKPGTRTSAGILVPATGTPTRFAFRRTLGRPDAPVHLTVWSDFQCPECKTFAETSERQLITDYVVPGKLLIEYRDDDTVGPESDAAAAAARCADAQDMFWPYHDVLFANQAPANTGALVPARLKDMADAIGLDRTKFDACLPGLDVFNDARADTHAAQQRGTAVPLLDFGLGSAVLEGSPPYDTLKATIDALLAQAPVPVPSGASAPAGPSAPAPSSAAAPSAAVGSAVPSAAAGSAGTSAAASARP